MPKKKLAQRHSVTMRIRTPMRIPWVSKKGVTFVLASDKEKIGEVRITGSHIHVRRPNKINWVRLTFEQFLDRLLK